MWTFLKRIILFPLDLVYCTIDAWRISGRWFKHRLVRREKDQPCLFCRGEDTSETPHPARSALRYRNLWLVRMLSPCVRQQGKGPRRLPICTCDGGYFKAPAYVPLVALGLTLFWLGGSLGILRASSSEPDHFWSNFITFFSPERTMGKDREDPDFLEAGAARLNPERAEKYFQSGIRHFDQRKYPQAQVDFKIALQSDPGNAELHYYLAKSLMALGQVVQAESSLLRALELDADQVEASLMLAELLERRESRTEALKHAAHALAIAPDNLEAIRMNLILQAAEGRVEEARSLVARMLEKDGENPDTLALVGKITLNTFKDPETAKTLLMRSLDRDDQHVPTLLALVPLYAGEQDLDQVNATLKKILSIEPDNLNALRLDAEMLSARYGVAAGLRAYSRLLNQFGGDLGLRMRYAELLLQAGQISEGKKLAEQLTSSRVPAVERSAHWMLAQLYGKARMFEEAEEHARRTLILAPGSRNVQLYLGKVLLDLGKPGEAKLVLETAMADHPGDLTAVDLLSQALIALDETARAEELIRELLKDNPDLDVMRNRLVEINMRGDDWRQSLGDARILYEKFPDNPALANNFAFQLARSGSQVDRALEIITPLYEKYTDNPVILDTYAFVLAAGQQHQEAIGLFEKALRLAPGNTSIRFHLARSLMAVGEGDRARMELQAVLKIDPGFHDADEVKDLLLKLGETGVPRS